MKQVLLATVATAALAAPLSALAAGYTTPKYADITIPSGLPNGATSVVAAITAAQTTASAAVPSSGVPSTGILAGNGSGSIVAMSVGSGLSYNSSTHTLTATGTTLTIPTAPLLGGNGSALVTVIVGSGLSYNSGTGTLSATGGGSGITALTGDVTASGSGSVAATVNSYNGGTPFGSAAGVATGTAGATIPENNGANVESGGWTFNLGEITNGITNTGTISSTGLVTASAGLALNVGAIATPSVYFGSATTTGFFQDNLGAQSIGIATNGVHLGCFNGKSIEINQGGSGTCSAQQWNGSAYPGVQIDGLTVAAADAVNSWSASGSQSGPVYASGRGNSGVVGTYTAVGGGYQLREDWYGGADGTAFRASVIGEAYVQGTVSAGVVPGAYTWGTESAAGTMTAAFGIDDNQHFSFSPSQGGGTAYTAPTVPTLTGATMDDAYSTDNCAEFTATATSITLTFAHAKTTYFHYTVSSNTGTIPANAKVSAGAGVTLTGAVIGTVYTISSEGR